MSLPKNRDPNKTEFQDLGGQDRAQGCRAQCARLTGSGRSAVAVVALWGEDAGQALMGCFTPATSRPFAAGEVRFGKWCRSGEDGESVVVTPLDSDSFEVHCHGGPAAIARIIDDLQQFGVDSVDADRWQPAPAGPLVIREAQQVLTQCRTSRLAAVALDQVRGALCHWARQWQQRLADGSTDDREFEQQRKNLLEAARFGTRLSEPFRVVLCGAPNVGKSSLVNALVGYQRSITTDSAGTTRDVVHADTVFDGIPIRLSDTAGLREAGEPIEREGILRAADAIRQADLVVRVRQPDIDFPSLPPATGSIDVLNKADLLPKSVREKQFAGEIPTVAVSGKGIERLIDAIARKLAESIPQPATPVPLTDRQVECLRQLLAPDPILRSRLLEKLIAGDQ